jgi:hypothetical protein
MIEFWRQTRVLFGRNRSERRRCTVKCKILWFALAVIPAGPATVWPADISGVWKVETPVRDPEITRAWFEFSVDGSKLTGSAMGFMEDERPILDGKVTDDKVFFTLKEYAGDRVLEYRYQGKVSGDTIKFKVYQLGKQSRSWHFTAQKASP